MIAVVLNASSKEHRRIDSETLLNYGFGNFKMKTIYDKDEVIAEVPVKRGQKQAIGLIATGPVCVVVPRDDSNYKITEEFNLPDMLDAPVKEGDVVGTLRLKNPDGKLITEVELNAQESLERLGFLPNLLRQTGEFVSKLWQRLWPL